ncbi:hypothetical protein PBRA_000062, partial [Plasmodiophora brassicae]
LCRIRSPGDHADRMGMWGGPADATRPWHGLVQAFAVIAASEFADKTFMLALILAMSFAPSMVFIGSSVANAITSTLAVVVGSELLRVVPVAYLHWGSIVLYIAFGLQMLVEAFTNDNDDGLEVAGVAAHTDPGSASDTDVESLISHQSYSPARRQRRRSRRRNMTGLAKSFTLTLLGECGDRSQIALLAMIADRIPTTYILVGSLAAHTTCSAIACYAGRLLATRISGTTVSIVGALLFFASAAQSAWAGVP